MGKMSELDMYQSDIEALQDQAMLNTSDDILILNIKRFQNNLLLKK